MSTTTTSALFPSSLDHRIMFGAAAWSLTIVFFVGQAVAQIASTAPYSLADNDISDLGSTTCGPITALTYHGYACAPLHAVMNAAFVALGLLTLLGVIGTYRAWPRRRLRIWGMAFLCLGGVGPILAGLAPVNVNLGPHVVGGSWGFLVA